MTENSPPQRNHPAHLPPIQRHNQPIIIFITLCIQPRKKALNNQVFQDAFRAASQDANLWLIGRYMIMPDHIHLFCSPASNAPPVNRWVAYIKELITKRHHPNWRWQSGCWDTQMRSPRHYQEKWNYVRQNPVRAGLVDDSDDWEWQGRIHDLHW